MYTKKVVLKKYYFNYFIYESDWKAIYLCDKLFTGSFWRQMDIINIERYDLQQEKFLAGVEEFS